MSKVLILIPSRMSAQRLPGKPLLEINNIPVISHVVKRGQEANIGEVVVCAEDEAIISAVKKNGGEAILTGSKHRNGTERIFEGLQKLNINNVDYIMSLQGDEPAINPKDIKNLYHFMAKYNPDIGTLASEVKENSMLHNENIVKVKTIKKLKKDNFVEAINFSREILYTPRKILGGQTSLAGAITFALDELASNKYIGTRKVIDISGDGRANTGVHPMSVRDMAIENGVTINALTILNEEPFLDEYYEYSVIGGQGSFVMVAEDYTDFATAIFQKLLREIGLPLAYKSKPYNGENTIFSSVIFK